MPADPYNINILEVEQSAKEWMRIAIRLPHHCVIILDNIFIGPQCIRQFEDTPHGWNQARRFAVRMRPKDIDSAQSLEELEAEYNKELGLDTRSPRRNNDANTEF